MVFERKLTETIQEGLIYYINGQRFISRALNCGENTYKIKGTEIYLFAENIKAEPEIRIDAEYLDIGIKGYNKVFEVLQSIGCISRLMISVVLQNTISIYNENTIEKNYNLYIEINLTYNVQNYPFTITRSKILSPQSKDNILNELLCLAEKIVMKYRFMFTLPLMPLKSNKYHTILAAEVGGLLIHECIGHNLEADIYYKKDSLLNNKIGMKIFNSTINISDCCNKSNYINFELSSDGTKAQNVNLIKSGIVESVMSDKFTSLYYHIADTGNGRIASFENRVLPRMRNTYLEKGCCHPEQMVNSMKEGLIALESCGGSVDVVTGEFILHVSIGGIIMRGELVGLTFPYILRGNVLQTLNCISEIGNDLEFKHTKCIKDGQEIKVSFGCPTIRLENQNVYC